MAVAERATNESDLAAFPLIEALVGPPSQCFALGGDLPMTRSRTGRP